MKKERIVCDVCNRDVTTVTKSAWDVVYDGNLFVDAKAYINWPPRGAEKYKIEKTDEFVKLMKVDLCRECRAVVEKYYEREYESIIKETVRE